MTIIIFYYFCDQQSSTITKMLLHFHNFLWIPNGEEISFYAFLRMNRDELTRQDLLLLLVMDRVHTRYPGFGFWAAVEKWVFRQAEQGKIWQKMKKSLV